jgi:hypothetical protein
MCSPASRPPDRSGFFAAMIPFTLKLGDGEREFTLLKVIDYLWSMNA